LTITDPDQPTTTFSITADGSAQTSLPSGLPSMIYAPGGPPAQPDDSTLVSILFDLSLDWPFVISNQNTAAQIFAFMPTICAVAVGIDASQVLSYGLKVNIPTSYQSTQDSSQLGTIWLAWMPSDTVSELAREMKLSSSAFYNGVQNVVAHDLASHVISGFDVTSVPPPSSANSGNGGLSDTGATSDPSDKTREDAIIGVVSALGAIALCVLLFLGYRAYQRRQEIAHRRLSDPPTDAWNAGIRQEGRDYDQDSIGGQRRRSFYFAEDSLRTVPQTNGQEMAEAMRTSPTGGMSRRIVPNAISAPRLQESTMNW